jgi:hypothetical protein
MKRAVALCFLMACGGSGKSAAPVEPEVKRPPVDHPEESDPDDGLDVQSTRGHLDPDEIQEALEPHAQAMQDCYLDKVGKQKWLGGKVELKWEVDGTGAQTATLIDSSDLGAWPIEQCLLAEARATTFPAPHGDKPTDFTVPFDFSAPRPAGDWDEDQSNAVVSKHVKDLSTCAKSAKTDDPTDVTVTLYLGTRGKVQSAGFASPATIPDAWAACAEKKVLGWQLTDPKGQVVKVSFVYRQGETPPSDEEGDE